MLERMDFDIGTLIYILVTLVAVIAGAFSKKKKPAAGSTAGSTAGEGNAQEDHRGGGFFSRLEEQFEGFVDETKQAAQEVTREFTGSEEALEEIRDDDFQFAEDLHEERKDDEVSMAPSAFATYEGVFDPDMLMNKDLIEAEAKRGTELQVIELDEQGHADYYEIVKDFDLGTAVIYSAIISRPDY